MSSPGETQLPVQLLRPVDAACDAFELAWKQGKHPRIEEYLGGVSEGARPVLLAELIRTELEWRYRRGELPAAGEYQTRFPSCAAEVDPWLAEAQSSASQITAGATTDTAQPSQSTGTFTSALVEESAQASPAAAPAAAPPRMLGEYELLDRLGAGGMGEVYRARHVRLDKQVALKLLPAHSQQAKDRLRRFLREMKAMGSLDHPNLIEAYDAGESAGLAYLVMKLIEGTDLGELVRQRGPLPVAEACDLVRQAALGLDYLHQRGLIHRDVKPSNLMRTPAGVLKILDLGLARWHLEEGGEGELTTAGQLLGTPDYLAPEQAAGDAVDGRADLYALGGTLFYLLTGKPPFANHRRMLDKLNAHRHEAAPDVRQLRSDVPPELAELIGRLLAKRPEDRPQTPAGVVEALAPFAGSSTAITVAAPGVKRPRARSARARRLKLAGAVSLLVVLLALAGWLLWRDRQRGEVGVPAIADGSQDGPAIGGGRPEDETATAEKVHVDSLEVKHYILEEGATRRVAVLGKDSFSTVCDDTVTVQARLSRPAYAYLIAFRPDGTDEVCFPVKEDERPPLTDKPSYPFANREEGYGLTEGAGLHVFALVVSSKPLPSYKEWRAKQRAFPWTRQEAPADVVWMDSDAGVEPLTPDSPLRGTRSKGRAITGQTPLARLTRWLRQCEGVDTVSAIGFAVLPKDKR